MRQLTRRALLCAAPLVLAPTVLYSGAASGATAHAKVKKPKLSGTIIVDAASSLTAAFTQIGAKFHKEFPHATITFNFGSSNTLAKQIQAGAQADVFASASLADMDTVVSSGLVRVAPQIFARNTLEIAVKPGNPANITGPTSLASASSGVIALCGAAVPCGIYAANTLNRAGVVIPSSRITRQPNATSTVDQVAYGDATAAIVYATDVRGQGSLVQGVKIPINQNTIADYPIARLTLSKNSKLAQAFVAFVESHNGQRSLAAQDFLAP